MAADLASQADLFVDLACLTYSSNESPQRRQRAEQLLDDHPGIAGASLFAAAVVGDVDSARALLDGNPALVTTRGGPRGWDALLYLSYGRVTPARPGWDALAVARLLLERGADPNTHVVLHDSCWFTALTGAMGEGEAGLIMEPPHAESRALAKLLLDSGADPNDGQGLYNTHFSSDDHWLELLISYGLNATHKVNWGARRMSTFDYLLGAAIKKGNTHRAALLLAQGAAADGRDSYNDRPHYENAILQGETAIAELLVRYGAKPLPVVLEPSDELRIACLRGDLDAARRLFDDHPQIRDDAGILMAIVGRASLEVVRFLLDLGFGANAHGENGVSPLHQAANAGQLDVVQELVERGASLTTREGMYGGTPAGWAEYCSDSRGAEVLAYLLDRTTDIHDLVYFGRVDRLADLLARDPSLVEARTPSGKTVLHLLNAPESVEEMVDLLLSHGAELDALDAEGRTPLDVLAEQGSESAAAALRRRGAHRSARP